MMNRFKYPPLFPERTARVTVTDSAAVMVLAIVLSGCAAQGTPYPDVMAHAPPLDDAATRVVFLRGADRYDDYSASPAVIRIDDDQVARLAYGGFFYVDVAPGTATIVASARRTWVGKCELQLHAVGGDTVYFDVGPRRQHVIAGVLGSIAGGAAAEAALPAGSIDRVLLDAAVVGGAAGVAGAVASSVESAGRPCGGPYYLRALSGDEAEPRLRELVWSR